MHGRKGLRVRQGALFSGIPEGAFEKRGTYCSIDPVLQDEVTEGRYGVGLSLTGLWARYGITALSRPPLVLTMGSNIFEKGITHSSYGCNFVASQSLSSSKYYSISSQPIALSGLK